MQTITEKSTASEGIYPIARLTEAQYNAIHDQLDIPGVLITEQNRPGGQDKRFAPGLLSVVRGLVSSEVEVRPGGG